MARPRLEQVLPIYESMTACAADTGLPLALIRKAKQSGAKCFKYGRVDLKKLLSWLGPWVVQERQEELPMDPVQQGPRALEAWKARREKLKFERESGLAVGRDEVRQDVAEALALLVSELDTELCSSLPPRLVGLDELAIRSSNKSALSKALTACRRRLEPLLEEPKQVEADDDEGVGLG